MLPRRAFPIVAVLMLGASVSARAATIQITMENLVVSPLEAGAKVGPAAVIPTATLTSRGMSAMESAIHFPPDADTIPLHPVSVARYSVSAQAFSVR